MANFVEHAHTVVIVMHTCDYSNDLQTSCFGRVNSQKMRTPLDFIFFNTFFVDLSVAYVLKPFFGAAELGT